MTDAQQQQQQQTQDQYTQATTALSNQASAKLASFWATLNVNEFEATRQALYGFYPGLMNQFCVAAAELALTFYGVMRAQAGITSHFNGHHSPIPPASIAKQNVDNAVNSLYKYNNPDQALGAIQGDIILRVMTVARDTMYDNGGRDFELGTPVRWKIVTDDHPCDWCKLLAGSYRYLSADSARRTFHRSCQCDVVCNFAQ